MPMEVRIQPTEIESVLEVHTGIVEDERGSFSESYSSEMWSRAGFEQDFVQDNLSRSCRGTLRGMHYQINPDGMGKLVRCLSGAIFDVAVDLRRSSETFGQWVGRELSGANGVSLWVPVGFAHGFVALEEGSLVHYKCTAIHTPANERSLSYRDPRLGIAWPIAPTVVSAKDEEAPLFDAAEMNFD